MKKRPVKDHIIIDDLDDADDLIENLYNDGRVFTIVCKGSNFDDGRLFLETERFRYISAQRWGLDRHQLQDFFDEAGHGEFISPGSMAMALFRKKFAKKGYLMMTDGYRARACKNAVYGGRSEAYKIGKFTLNKYDVNSCYPYIAMNTDLSLPHALTYTRPSLGYMWDCDGVAFCYLTQFGHIPVLPIRHQDRVYYAQGETLRGWYTHHELRYAYEQGAAIHPLKQYTYDNPNSSVSVGTALRPFMSYCLERKETSAFPRVWKLVANCLVGRLGSYAASDGPSLMAYHSDRLILDQRRGETVTVDVDMALPLKAPHGGNIWIGGQELDAFLPCNPFWAAIILSEARILLHRLLLSSLGPAYCDTDCIMAKSNPFCDSRIGTEPGQFKLEVDSADIRGAKIYRFGDTFKYRGKPKQSRTLTDFYAARITNERGYDKTSGETVPLYLEGFNDDGSETEETE